MIVVSPLHALDTGLAHWGPSHVVSLTSPGTPDPLIAVEAEVLRLRFHDIAEPRPGLVPVNAQDVSTLIQFAGTWSRNRPLVVHCWAGVSRSTAAAYVVACLLQEPGAEARLSSQLRRLAPFATPNARLVAIADDLLGRDGRMVDAIDRIGRGAEVSMGRCFEWTLP